MPAQGSLLQLRLQIQGPMEGRRRDQGMERDQGGGCEIAKWLGHTVGSTPSQEHLGQTLGEM